MRTKRPAQVTGELEVAATRAVYPSKGPVSSTLRAVRGSPGSRTRLISPTPGLRTATLSRRVDS